MNHKKQQEETALAKKDGAALLVEAIKPEIAKTLPKMLDVERFARIALSELRRVPKLMECSKQSLLSCLMQSAQLGLEPGGPLQHAHLIPFGSECTFIIGYQGLAELVYRAGKVKRLEAAVIYSNDYYKITMGTEPKIEHEELLVGSRGEPIAAYAVATLLDGTPIFEVMREDEIQSVKSKSRSAASPSSPWAQFPDEMRKKVVSRRLIKRLQKSVEDKALVHALEVDNSDYSFETSPKRERVQKKSAAPTLRGVLGVSEITDAVEETSPPEPNAPPLPLTKNNEKVPKGKYERVCPRDGSPLKSSSTPSGEGVFYCSERGCSHSEPA